MNLDSDVYAKPKYMRKSSLAERWGLKTSAPLDARIDLLVIKRGCIDFVLISEVEAIEAAEIDAARAARQAVAA